MTDKLWKLTEVAKYYGVVPRTVRLWVDRGEFPNALQLPGGHWRIPESDVKDLARRKYGDRT